MTNKTKNQTIRSYLTLTALSCSLLINPDFSMADEAGKACGADYQKFCAEVKPGEGRIGKCLQEHKDELSQSCRAFFQDATRTIIREFIAACQTDVANNCKGVQPGEGRILNCLRAHQENISGQCGNVIKKL